MQAESIETTKDRHRRTYRRCLLHIMLLQVVAISDVDILASLEVSPSGHLENALLPSEDVQNMQRAGGLMVDPGSVRCGQLAS